MYAATLLKKRKEKKEKKNVKGSWVGGAKHLILFLYSDLSCTACFNIRSASKNSD
jgi:hypothetical protein